MSKVWVSRQWGVLVSNTSQAVPPYDHSCTDSQP